MSKIETLSSPSLIGTLLPGVSGPRATLVRNVGLAVVGSLLLVIAAKIKVPFWPVPMTLQTLAVLMIGAAYGPRLGAATVALYIGYGFAGLPVFTNTPPVLAGPAYLLGPTGGFLAGFVIAAALAGWAASRGASMLRLVTGFAAAELVILGLGCLWLAFFAQMASGASGIGLAGAFAAGVQPFLLGDALKLALAVAATAASWRVLQRKG